ncbi:MAG: DUF177 domain-containing protein [Candidatus Omnitrophica bacterium]|nr:DUF177 domain-containing protein [Candidatus Omnitrophota bacterium]
MDLKHVSVRALEANEVLVDARVNAEALGLEETEMRFEGEAILSGVMSASGGQITADLALEGSAVRTCARCLEEYEDDFRHRWQIVVPAPKELTVNVLTWVREELIVEEPMSTLCDDECKGLCADCGQNLNDGPCNCPGAVKSQSPENK